MGVEREKVDLYAVGRGNECRIALEEEHLVLVGCEFRDQQRRGFHAGWIALVRHAGEGVSVHAALPDTRDHFVQIGPQRLGVGELLHPSGVVHPVEHLRTLVVHQGHVLRIVCGEVVGIVEDHHVERVGQPAHEVLFARRHGGGVVEVRDNQKVLT